MFTWRQMAHGLRSLVNRSSANQDVNDEIAQYIEEASLTWMERGLSREEAVKAARRELGNLSTVQEEMLSFGWENSIRAVLADLRFAFRQLHRSPGFAVTAMLTLALGIGSNTAIFSLFDQVILRALPVARPHQLVRLIGTGAWAGGTAPVDSNENGVLSYPRYRDLRENNHDAFAGLIASFPSDVGVLSQTQTDDVPCELVSGNYFDVLGITPALGRLFVPTDETLTGGNSVTVIAYRYWQDHFDKSPTVIGRTLVLNGRPFTIIGVSNPGFEGSYNGYRPALFVPITKISSLYPSATNGWLEQRRQRWLAVVGRLRDGQTVVSAESALAPLWHASRIDEYSTLEGQSPTFRRQYVDDSMLLLVDNSRGISSTRDQLSKPLWILLGMDTLLVGICGVNIATLLLLRSTMRIKEMSLRYALGANRRRILGQLLIEGGVLGGLGTVLGLAVTPIASSYFIHLVIHGPIDEQPYTSRIDFHILLFNLGMAGLVTLIFSIIPAIQFLRPAANASLKQNAGTASARSQTFRKLTVGLQIGLSVLLLIGAGLFVRTISNLRCQSLGYRTDHLLTFALSPSVAGYDAVRGQATVSRVLDALRALPGVTQVGATTAAELSGEGFATYFAIDGYNPAPREDMVFAAPNVTSGYFSALGIPIIAGRTFTEDDRNNTYKVAILSEAIAKRIFGAPRSAIGHVIGAGGFSGLKYDTQIVGVVAEVRHQSLRESGREPVYRPVLQTVSPDLTYYVRTSQNPKETEKLIMATVDRIDHQVPVTGLLTMPEFIDQSMSDENAMASLASSFSALALSMAAVGLYGVLAYSASQRAQEISIRVALGATRSAVVSLITREMAIIAAVSVIVAIVGAVFGSRLLESQLYEVKTFDPIALVCALAITTSIVILAAAIPIRRAVSIDPAKILRIE